MTTQVFVIGLDDFHRRQLATIRHADDCKFHGLLPYEIVVNPVSYPIEKMIEQGLKELEQADKGVDAIIGHWDFPTTALLALFRSARGLPGPSLTSTLIADHKYWSRLRQQEVCPDNIPQFQSVDPFDLHIREHLELDFPFWLKPVVGFSSQMVYRINDPGQLQQALATIRQRIGLFGEPFGKLMQRAEFPADIPQAINGWHCVAEKPIDGWQCTLEGYIQQGETVVYGVVDSAREGEHCSSFSRYEYPSQLPGSVQQRMEAITRRVVPALDLDDTPFNIEFFWDKEQDQIWLLETNTRISKSHSPLFADVAGASHHEVAVDVALGKRPAFPRHAGSHDIAIKFMLRHYEDSIVSRAPTQNELAQLEADFPGTQIQIEVKQGDRLSELRGQEIYSYEVAVIFMGGYSHEALMKRYQTLLERLPLEFKSVPNRGET